MEHVLAYPSKWPLYRPPWPTVPELLQGRTPEETEKIRKAYRAAQTESGLIFQDVCTEHLACEYRISVNMFCSKYYQTNIAECLRRWELKYDSRYSSTKNLFIEIAERQAWDVTRDFTPSGIFARTEMTHYGIGDESGLFLFEIGVLRDIYMNVLASRGEHEEFFVDNLRVFMDANRGIKGFIIGKNAIPLYASKFYKFHYVK